MERVAHPRVHGRQRREARRVARRVGDADPLLDGGVRLERELEKLGLDLVGKLHGMIHQRHEHAPTKRRWSSPHREVLSWRNTLARAPKTLLRCLKPRTYRHVALAAGGLVALLAGRKGSPPRPLHQGPPRPREGMAPPTGVRRRLRRALAEGARVLRRDPPGPSNREAPHRRHPVHRRGRGGLLVFPAYRPLWGVSAASFVGGWVLNFSATASSRRTPPPSPTIRSRRRRSGRGLPAALRGQEGPGRPPRRPSPERRARPGQRLGNHRPMHRAAAVALLCVACGHVSAPRPTSAPRASTSRTPSTTGPSTGRPRRAASSSSACTTARPTAASSTPRTTSARPSTAARTSTRRSTSPRASWTADQMPLSRLIGPAVVIDVSARPRPRRRLPR